MLARESIARLAEGPAEGDYIADIIGADLLDSFDVANAELSALMEVADGVYASSAAEGVTPLSSASSILRRRLQRLLADGNLHRLETSGSCDVKGVVSYLHQAKGRGNASTVSSHNVETVDVGDRLEEFRPRMHFAHVALVAEELRAAVRQAIQDTLQRIDEVRSKIDLSLASAPPSESVMRSVARRAESENFHETARERIQQLPAPVRARLPSLNTPSP